MKKIAIYGAGGFGREVHSLIEDINKKQNTFSFIGYFDDSKEKGTVINNFPVLGSMRDLNSWNEPLDLVIAIADPRIKKSLIDKMKNPKITFPVLIHPGVISGDPQFNSTCEGTIICAGTIITVNVEIGRHVILNLACTVGHDTKIGEFSSIMPGVTISGEVVIENSVFIGTGAKLINQLTIGENSTIGAGALVTTSVPPDFLIVGTPSRMAPKHLTESKS